MTFDNDAAQIVVQKECIVSFHQVLVVPALEMLSANVSYPATKTDAIKLVQQNILQVFQ